MFRYKLNGLDETWKQTADRSIYYPYLPPGDYLFKVKAVNNDGVESRRPAEIAFKIPPPFWKTWWFQLLIVLAAFSLPGWLVVSRQRRARKYAELEARNKQLVMAQRMELMGNLAAGTVHDLKNLLSIILGYSRMVSRKFAPDDPERENVETIRKTASTAVQMSKQILSLARYPDRLPGTVELGELLEEILDTLEITLPKTVKTRRIMPGEPVRFAIHPARFQQVVLNLCQNAAHAMPGGGELTVALSMPGNEIGRKIRLEIRDTGTGIEPDNIDKIFQPLFTTKQSGKGTGLGLFVVDQIVREHGGRIEVRSQPGTGTTFIIRFPYT
jgi:signal transduction histidine kinase